MLTHPMKLHGMFYAELTIEEINSYEKWAMTNEEIKKLLKLLNNLDGLEMISQNTNVNLAECMDTRDKILEEIMQHKVVVFNTIQEWYETIVSQRKDN